MSLNSKIRMSAVVIVLIIPIILCLGCMHKSESHTVAPVKYKAAEIIEKYETEYETYSEAAWTDKNGNPTYPMEPWDNFGSNADNAVKIARNYMPDNLIDNLSTEELIEFANSTVCEVFSIKINPVRNAAINNIMEKSNAFEAASRRIDFYQCYARFYIDKLSTQNITMDSWKQYRGVMAAEIVLGGNRAYNSLDDSTRTELLCTIISTAKAREKSDYTEAYGGINEYTVSPFIMTVTGSSSHENQWIQYIQNAELTDVEREYVDSAVNYYANNKVFRFRLE